ncbi:glycosyltransferase family 2 protein [uncultured Nitrosomonas sp.]|uniref:glycosyltransferase family 2 protein n=1 Tax=uncultured Nitrosomonas sp. TaxID=156424 RepID=UPI0025D4104E|nr:glycosyltransferase family 2 protein [uncultured Nitrosomonas sp.]
MCNENMVSVIIVNYYSAELTAQAVMSIFEDDQSVQIVVIDNSADEKEHARLKTKLPPQVECIASLDNIGFGSACNLGLERCKYEYIFLLNPDTKIITGCISKLKQALVADQRLGAVSPQSFLDKELKFFLPPGQLQTPKWELLNTLGYKWEWYGKKRSQWFRRYSLSVILSQSPIEQDMISGAHLMLSKKTIEKLGYLFDENFFLYYEDTDLNLRIRKLGLGLSLVPEAKAIHFWRNDPAKAKFATESRRIYMKKHFPNSWLLILKKIFDSLAMAPIRDYIDLGSISETPRFKVEDELEKQWVLEISPYPFFIPSVIKVGSGRECVVPHDILELLGSGEFWARIGKANKIYQVYKWSYRDK